MPIGDATAARVSDYLSPVTRKERVWLLGTSLVAVLLTQAGLVPTEMTIFGAKFAHWDQNVLIVVLIFVVVYFLISFAVYAWSDFLLARVLTMRADTESDREYEKLLEREAREQLTEQDKILLYRYNLYSWVFKASNPTAKLRHLLDLGLPVGVAIYSITVMIIFLFRPL